MIEVRLWDLVILCALIIIFITGTAVMLLKIRRYRIAIRKEKALRIKALAEIELLGAATQTMEGLGLEKVRSVLENTLKINHRAQKLIKAGPFAEAEVSRIHALLESLTNPDVINDPEQTLEYLKLIGDFNEKVKAYFQAHLDRVEQ